MRRHPRAHHPRDRRRARDADREEGQTEPARAACVCHGERSAGMTTQLNSRWLVSTDWLAARLGAPDIVPIDGSFYLPALKRDAAAEYLAGPIPAAVRFDIDAIADHSNPLPHMLPNAQQFAREVGVLGIAETDAIVVYDGIGLGGAPRVWWTFRLFGAEKGFILDGGLPKWKAERRPLETGPARRAPRVFRARQPG